MLARSRHGNLLPHQRANQHFLIVHGPRNPNPRGRTHTRRKQGIRFQVRIDVPRIPVRIKQLLDTPYRRRSIRSVCEFQRGLQRPLRIGHLYRAGAVGQMYGSGVAQLIQVGVLHSVDHTVGEKRENPRCIVGFLNGDAAPGQHYYMLNRSLRASLTLGWVNT